MPTGTRPSTAREDPSCNGGGFWELHHIRHVNNKVWERLGWAGSTISGGTSGAHTSGRTSPVLLLSNIDLLDAAW